MGLRICRQGAFAACAVAVLLGGCSSSAWHLHSPAREKQGQESQKAWSEVDASSPLTVTRKNIKAWLDEQTAVEDAIWTAHRNSRAQSMAYGWTLERYRTELDDRLQALAGKLNPEDRKKQRASLRVANAGLASYNVNLQAIGQPPPDCEALLKPDGLANAQQAAAKIENPAHGAIIVGGLSSALGHCRVIHEVTVKNGGELGSALALVAADELALDTDRKAAETLKNAYETAMKVYTESVQALIGNPEDDKTKQAVADAVKKLGDLVTNLSKAQDAFSTKFITEERLESLNGLLKTYDDVVAGKEVKDGNRIAIALALFPEIRMKASKALSDAKKPYLLPLAMQKNVELAKLDATNRAIDLRKQIIAERKTQVAAIDAQLDALTQARQAFQRQKSPSPTNTNAVYEEHPDLTPILRKTLVDVMNGTEASLSMRTKLWRSTALFLDAEGRLRADVGKAFYRISALEHEQVLTYAESGLNQWKALIDPSVELIAAYSAAGVKVTDITGVLNSVTLLWIAYKMPS